MVEEYDGMWSSSSSPHLSNLYVQHMGVRAGGTTFTQQQSDYQEALLSLSPSSVPLLRACVLAAGG